MRRAVLALALLVACGVPATPRPVRHSDFVRRDELEEVSSRNLLEALQVVRPLWFRSRPVESAFEGQSYLGPVAVLRDYWVSEVEVVRRMSESETSVLYGTSHAGPSVILERRK